VATSVCLLCPPAGFLPEVAPEGEQPRVLEALKCLLEEDLGCLPAVLEAAANMHLDRDLQVGTAGWARCCSRPVAFSLPPACSAPRHSLVHTDILC
jgi:hypothetical protein